MIDNSAILASLIDETPDPDHFWYTELLDRSEQTKRRLVKAFEHRDRHHFIERAPVIREMCRRLDVRAYFRAGPRSRKAVAHECMRQTMEQCLSGHHSVRGVYSSACGKTSVKGRRVWVYDVDEPSDAAERVEAQLREHGMFIARVPSRRGYHLLCKPHDIHGWTVNIRSAGVPGVDLRHDNPTNLFIPEGAA